MPLRPRDANGLRIGDRGIRVIEADERLRRRGNIVSSDSAEGAKFDRGVLSDNRRGTYRSVKPFERRRDTEDLVHCLRKVRINLTRTTRPYERS